MSQRLRPDGIGRQPGYVSFTEAEDVLAAAADADMMMVDRNPAGPSFRVRRVVGRGLRWLPTHRTGPRLLPPRRHRPAAGLRHRYDVAVFVGFTLWDLALLEELDVVRRRVGRLIVWLPESWASELDDRRLRHEPITLADRLFIGIESTAERLAELADRPVHYLPPAVDAKRFAAADAGAPRPIDVLGIGRRDERLHRALLGWARDTDRLYVYDTISGMMVPDVVGHRENLAETYRRTKIALTNSAKFDQPQVTRGERETPGRMWEGLAGGAVMVGSVAPDPGIQKRAAGEVVVGDLPDDLDAAIRRIEELCDTEMAGVRRHNMRLALHHHDWIHRWREIFERSGLDVPEGISSRIDELDALADAMTGPSTPAER
ncbi:MAG: hypothetical protein ACFCVK_12830 [Acidimicrobiales bacterium]